LILKVSRDGFRGGYSVTDEIRWEACVPGHFELRDYFPILLMLVFSAGFAVTQVLMSQFVGQQKRTRTKLMPYECGKDPVGSARERFSVKFYLIAMIFILFDIEVIFLIPWAVVFRSFSIAGAGSLVYVEMMLLPEGIWLPRVVRINGADYQKLFDGITGDSLSTFSNYVRFSTEIKDVKVNTPGP